jgi:hypothetical protein
MKLEFFLTLPAWIVFVPSWLATCAIFYMAYKYQGSLEQKWDNARGVETKFKLFKFAIPAAISLAWLLTYYIGN